MLGRMRPGSVVVDIAIDQGGNCWGTKKGETLIRNGVKLIGASDLPSSVPNHASSLYARNLLALLQPFLKDGEFSLNLEDELIAGSLLSHQGEIRFPELCIAAGAN
jgi:NAD(P) transhydrogenase subunit alpha